MTKYDRYNASPKGKARNIKYDGTAKGMLRKIRHEAKRRKG